MNANLIRLQGLTFAAKGDSGHWVMLDGPEELGGADAAARPKELILFGFAGCTGMDVASILTKRRRTLDRFEIQVEADVADTHPKVFTHIHLTFLFKGKDLTPKEVERAIELSRTKYCGVWAMLKQAVDITYAYKIMGYKNTDEEMGRDQC
jgi:putative redox protein